jgi:hypothetical protein
MGEARLRAGFAAVEFLGTAVAAGEISGALGSQLRKAMTRCKCAPKIDVSALDFSTEANKAVFYSGPGNHARAMAFAERSGATPIDLTPGGRHLNSLNLYDIMPAEQADAIWAQASKAYAEGAQGKINLFVHRARPDRVFHTVEAPIIKANPYIYKQTFHY